MQTPGDSPAQPGPDLPGEPVQRVQRVQQPVAASPPAPPPRRTNRGCLWAAVILGGLGLLTTVALVAALWSIGRGGNQAAGGAAADRIEWDEEYISGSGTEKIAVLPVEGVIGDAGGGVLGGGGVTPEELRSQLDQAAADPAVRALVVAVNSPGGGAVASDIMYRDILDFKTATRKPVVVAMGDVAASGGVYVAAAGDRIVANPITLTGSIGVILQYLNYGDALRRYGVESVTIKSGPFKDIASSTRDLTEQERRILQDYVDQAYSRFVDVVDQGRRTLNRQQVLAFANGSVFSGQRARDLGLVDELGDLDTATDAALRLANLGSARVVRYEPQGQGLFELFGALAEPREPELVTTLKALGLDTTPRLEYIYRP